jgi:hypothetical protein
MRYLEHEPPEGMTADSEKLEVVQRKPLPRDKHELRSFLGLCKYYRRFIAGYTYIAKPMTQLTEVKRIQVVPGC